MPRRFREECARRRSAHEPAGFSSTGRHFRPDAQQENRHAGGFCGQCKTTARGEIIGARLTPEFEDHRTKSRTSRALKPGLESGRHIARPDEQEARRVKPQFRPSRRVRRARLARERFMPNP